MCYYFGMFFIWVEFGLGYGNWSPNYPVYAHLNVPIYDDGVRRWLECCKPCDYVHRQGVTVALVMSGGTEAASLQTLLPALAQLVTKTQAA